MPPTETPTTRGSFASLMYRNAPSTTASSASADRIEAAGELGDLAREGKDAGADHDAGAPPRSSRSA